MQESQASPLARLVLFIVCLSIAGSIAAGVHYFAVDLPEQKALSEHPPANPSNSDTQEKCNTCLSSCTFVQEEDYYQCLALS